MSSVFRRVWRWTAAIVAGLVIVLAMAVGAFRLFLPQLPEYRAQIETWATQALGRPLKIGDIDARLSLAGPLVVFRDTVVLAPDGVTPVVDADSISVVISLMDLLLEQELAVSSVRIEGIVLEVEQLEDGRFYVLNRVLPAEPGDVDQAGTGKAPVMPNGRYEIRNATIRMTSARRPGEPLEFQQATLDVEKSDSELSLGVNIYLPDNLGGSLRITANTENLDAGPGKQNWQLLFQARGLDLAGWKEVLPDTIDAPLGGSGDITVWAALGALGLENGIVDLDLRDLILSDPDSVPGAAFQHLGGKLEWVKKPDDWQFKLLDLSVERDGRIWNSDAIRLELARKNGDGRLLYMTADRIHLDDFQPFLPWVPDEEIRARLMGLNPRGVVSDLNLQFASEAGGNANYSVRAYLSGAGVNAVDKLPGVQGFTGAVKANDDGGEVELSSVGLAVDLPKVFESPLVFEQATGKLSWQRSASGIKVRGADLVLANQDIYTYSTLNLELPKEGAGPAIDLETQIKDGNVANKTAYLPIVKLSSKAREWLERSIVSGRIPEGRMVLKGPLDKFPFKNGEGRFTVDFLLNDLVLDYKEGWPEIRDLNTHVVFEGPGISVDAVDGNMAGNQIVTARAEIPVLGEARLTVRGQTEGTVTAGLDYLAAIPPGERYIEAINGLEASGQARVDLELYLPLKEIHNNRLTLDMQLMDAAVRPVGLNNGLEKVNGRLLLKEGDLSGQGVNATYLGKPVRVDVSPDPSTNDVKATLMLLRGLSNADELMEEFFPIIKPWVSGKTDWFAVARFPSADSQQPVTVSARSVLGGMGLSLPQPMFKNTEDVRMLEVLYTLRSRDQRSLELALGDDVRAYLDFRREDDDFELAFGDIALGGKVPDRSGEPGLGISGRTAILHLDEWLGLDNGESPDPNGTGLTDILKRAELKVDQFKALSQDMGPAALQLRNANDEWVAIIDSENILGQVTVPQDAAAELPTRVDMERMILMGSEEEEEGEEGRLNETDPRTLRPYEIRVKNFGIGDMRFGTLEAIASKAPMGLNADVIRTTHPSFSGEGVGSWLVTDDGQMTGLKLELRSSNILETFKSLGLGEMISGERASAEVDVYWRGGPDGNFRSSLSGQVHLQLDDGTVAEIDPGAGRALGLLSVAMLPRRLTLDFRDVFDEGLAFDRISGDFNLVDGNAYTTNLVMKGPSVGIAVSGRTGLVDRTYDQVAVVHANIGSTLPLAGALAGGPTLGAALLIFSEVFKTPLQGMTRARYKVSGSWDNPDVERLELSSPPPPSQPEPAPKGEAGTAAPALDETGLLLELDEEGLADEPEQLDPQEPEPDAEDGKL